MIYNYNMEIRIKGIRRLMKHLLWMVILVACSQSKSQDQEGGILINGKVDNPQIGIITIDKIEPGKFVPMDTIVLNDDQTYSYHFIGKPGFYRVNFYNKQMITLILDEDNITLNVDGSNPRGKYAIEGSSEMDMITKFNQDLSTTFQQREQDLNSKFVQAKQDKNESLAEKIRDEYNVLVNQKQEFTVNYIRSIGPNLAAFQLVNSLDKDAHFDFIDSLANVLNAKYPGRFYIADLVNQMKKAAITKVGKIAPEIELPDPNGELVRLSSFKGKVVLVDFWAGWCKPCRQENPNVVKAYHQFKSKGFTVLGVSLDRAKDKWLQAIKDDGLEWTQVSDLNYFQSKAAQAYGINAIPFSILLDREGRIIAKNLRGNDLENTLTSFFEKESNL